MEDMIENSEQKFEGFYKPEEKQALSQEQAEVCKNLEKVAFVNGHFEDYIGGLGLHVINRGENTPKIMTRPSALLNFVRETAKQNGVSPWDVTQAIRSYGIDHPDRFAEIQKRYKETITYVGDVHGGDEDLFSRLTELGKNPPEYLIFEGDIIGTKNFEDLQRIFYNWVNNHSKNEILKSNPNASDQEVLEYKGTKPPEEDFTLKKGFLKLRKFELELAGKSEEEIVNSIGSLSDQDIANEIRRYAKFVHYGHYASNLPDEAKATLAKGLEANAQKLVDSLKPLIEKGTLVVMIQGNWDARAPIDFVPGVEAAVPLPENERLFNPKKFFEEKGITFYDRIATIETKTTLQVLFPFDSLINFSNIGHEQRQELIEKVKKAKEDNKSIVVVAHGEPNYEIHNLTVANATASGEHAQIVKGFTEALSLVLPDEIIYGHMHDPIVDKNATKMDVNIKYALALDENGTPALLDNTSNFNRDSMLATYIPMRRIAEAQVPRFSKNKKIKGLGGVRQPAKVIA